MIRTWCAGNGGATLVERTAPLCDDDIKIIDCIEALVNERFLDERP
jgi:hypothetical protein